MPSPIRRTCRSGPVCSDRRHGWSPCCTFVRGREISTTVITESTDFLSSGLSVLVREIRRFPKLAGKRPDLVSEVYAFPAEVGIFETHQQVDPEPRDGEVAERLGVMGFAEVGYHFGGNDDQAIPDQVRTFGGEGSRFWWSVQDKSGTIRQTDLTPTGWSPISPGCSAAEPRERWQIPGRFRLSP